MSSAVGRTEPIDPRILVRYKQMLATNPVEGIAMDRLWKAAVDENSTERLLAEFRAAGTFAGEMVLGHLLRRSGNEETASQAFDRAAKLDATSPLPHLALATLESDRSNPRNAALALEKACALLTEDDVRLPDSLLRLGSAWHAAGDAAKASAAWERTVVLNPKDFTLRRRLADSYASGMLYDSAIGHLRFVAENGPVMERANALQQIARLNSAGGSPAKAMEALEQAAAMTAPGNWLRTDLNRQIIRLAQRQQADGALEKKWLAEAEGNPRDLGAALRMVELYERTGALAQQQQWLERVTSLAPKSHDYRLRLARVLRQLDNLDAAAAQLDQLAIAQPNDSDLVFEHAQLDLQREDTAAARKRITEFLATRKTDESLRTKALEFYQENRLLDLAEEALRANAAGNEPEPLQSLAAFYFGQKRDGDALQTLSKLVRPTDPPADQAAAHFRIAQALKLQSSLTAAVEQMQHTVKLAPDVREHQVMLGELLTSLSRGIEARPPLEKAWALSKNDAERLDADQKLFASFRARALAADEDPDLMPRRQNKTAAEVEDFIRLLMDRANSAKNAASWQRVAQWKAWNGDKGGAMTYATKASELEPKNPLPIEFMAQHAAANGDPAAAIRNLRRLVELNPASRDAYLRQLAQLEMLSGNNRESLRILEDLANRNLGNPDALADLANAQERGDLSTALETWRKAQTIASPQRKREFSGSILRVLQAQKKYEEAAELLLRMVDETLDEKEKSGRFDELLLHAQQHNQMLWLRGVLEKRRKLRADDYFTAVSLGRVFKYLGEKAAAFDLFADAVFSASNQEQALPDLIREAEELRRFDTAIRLQEQLTRVATQDRPDGFLKLASLQERTGDLEGAERSWGRAIAKFPRDFEIVRRAADFHLAWGDPARATALLRKLAALDPSYIRGGVELGVMELRGGNPALAKAAFESVLRVTKPLADLALFPTRTGDSPWTERITFERGAAASSSIFSGSGRSDIRHAWMSGELLAVSPSAAQMNTPERPTRLIAPTRSGTALARLSPEAEWRLLAIRGAAEAVKQLGDSKAWTRDWIEAAKATPNEAIWALFYADRPIETLDLIEPAMVAKAGDLSLTQAYVSIALETKQLEQLSRWLDDDARYAVQRQAFSLSFLEHLQKGANFSPADAARLFPPQATARLWTSGLHLARHRMLEPALELGSRAVKLFDTDRAPAFREMSRWNLPLGRIETSRNLLAQAVSAPSDSLESPPLAALFETFSLAPLEQRTAFAEAELAKYTSADLQDRFRRLILLRLLGRKSEALAELHAILDNRMLGQPGFDRSNTAHRELLWLSGAADMLLQWDMPDLATAVWARALFDSGLAALKSRLPVRERVEGSRNGTVWARYDAVEDIFDGAANQLDALRYAMGSSVERAEILASRVRSSVRNDQVQSGKVVADPNDRDEPLLSLAEALRNLQAWPSAVEVCVRAWELNSESPRVLRELLDACLRSGDEVTAERIRRRCVEEHISPGNDSTLRQFALDLAEPLERRGSVDEAIRIITGALNGSPGDFGLLRRQTLLLQRAGRSAESAQILQKLSEMTGGTAVAHSQLASLFEQQEKFTEALEVRLRGGGLDTRAPLLLFKNNRLDEGVALLEKFSGITAVEPASELAAAMSLAGDPAGARSVLVSLISRIPDPRVQFSLRGKILALPGAHPSAEFIARTQERMRALAEVRPELTDRYYEFFQQHASRLGIAKLWKAELVKTWASPKAPTGAGFALLHAFLREKNSAAAATTLSSILDRANSPKFPFPQLMLVLADEPTLRVAAAKRAVELAMPNPAALEDYVALLDSLGRREDARAALTQYEWVSSFAGNAAILGRLWTKVGDFEKAQGLFAVALRERPLSSRAPALAGMAHVHSATGNRESSTILLRRAYLEPSFRDFDPLVEFLVRNGELANWKAIASDLGVKTELLHDLKLALFAHYEKSGRLGDALTLITANPEMLSPASQRLGAVSLARVRALAGKTGDFKSAIAAFEALAKAPDAESELAMLNADWCIARDEPAAAVPFFIAAANSRPGNWECVRRTADAYLSAGRKGEVRQVLERFVAITQNSSERDAAVELWETAVRK